MCKKWERCHGNEDTKDEFTRKGGYIFDSRGTVKRTVQHTAQLYLRDDRFWGTTTTKDSGGLKKQDTIICNELHSMNSIQLFFFFPFNLMREIMIGIGDLYPIGRCRGLCFFFSFAPYFDWTCMASGGIRVS